MQPPVFFFFLAFSAFSTENICNEATGHADPPEEGLLHSPTIIALNMMHTWDRQWLAHNAGSVLRQGTQTRHTHTAHVTYLCTWSAGPELRKFKLYRRFSSTLQVSPLLAIHYQSSHWCSRYSHLSTSHENKHLFFGIVDQPIDGFYPGDVTWSALFIAFRHHNQWCRQKLLGGGGHLLDPTLGLSR